MKSGWREEKLSDVCSFLNRGISPRYLDAGGICVLNQKCIRDHCISYELARRHDILAKKIGSERLIRAGDVLVNSTGTGTLGRIAQLRKNPPEPTTVDSHITIVRPISEKFYPEFFGYMLWAIEDAIKEAGEGCGGQTELARYVLAEKFVVHYPDSLVEQKRIVNILDEAFDGIDIVKANAEKNLQNACALFESYLQSIFTRRGAGWMEKPLGEICDFVRGPFGGSLRKSIFVAHGYAVYEQQHAIYNQFDSVRYFVNEAKFHDMKRFELLPNDLIMSCSGTMGRVAIVPSGIKRGIINQALLKLTPTAEVSNRFLKFWMESEAFQDALKEYSGGAAIQNVASVKVLKEIKLPLPSMKQQERVVEGLELMAAEAQRLESIYQQKLTTLDELKRSLLHRAFSGELTKASPKAIIIPFPQRIPNISPTDLHAGILAMGYQLHADRGKQDNYGHVKAEKIAHMIEAYVGIDLDRNPVKDAAGPNDFSHLKIVESRARKARFFDFQRASGSAYRVVEYQKFDSLIAQTRNALGSRVEEVDQLLELMLPMNTQRAEIFCTIYAAWNNLLMDGKTPTDEEIVFESRENWHPDKLKINRKRFFKAVHWMKTQGIVPTGKGKRVATKGK